MSIFPAFSQAFPTRPGSRTICLFLLLAVMLFGAAASRAAENLDEVSQLLKSGQHAKALEQVDRFLANKPKDAQGRFLKGIILTSLNKQTEAIAIFKKLTEDYPELPEPYNNLAVIYAQQKQYDKAKEALEMAIRTHPAYATAHENLGDIYSRLASQAYGKALQIDSTNASAQTKLAMINDLVGNTKATAGKVPAPTVMAAATEPVKPSPAPAAKPEPPKPEVLRPEPVKPSEPAKPVEPQKLAEAKPAPSPETSKPEPARAETAKAETAKADAGKSGDTSGEVVSAVDSWLAAWSKKDVKAYLAHYAKDFQTPGGQSRKEWETERAQRVGKPGKIEVGHEKLSIKAEGSDKMVVRFRQQYKSANLSTSSGKTLVMVRQDGKWLIQQERVGG